MHIDFKTNVSSPITHSVCFTSTIKMEVSRTEWYTSIYPFYYLLHFTVDKICRYFPYTVLVKDLKGVIIHVLCIKANMNSDKQLNLVKF